MEANVQCIIIIIVAIIHFNIAISVIVPVINVDNIIAQVWANTKFVKNANMELGYLWTSRRYRYWSA